MVGIFRSLFYDILVLVTYQEGGLVIMAASELRAEKKELCLKTTELRARFFRDTVELRAWFLHDRAELRAHI
jgi:hypothetical protein